MKIMGMRARGLASALPGIQGDAPGLRRGKGGPGKVQVTRTLQAGREDGTNVDFL